MKWLIKIINATITSASNRAAIINNSKVAYTDDAANIALAEWQSWVIDLSTVGGSLENVTNLTIGVDGANAAGMLYIDEIGLYP